MAETPNHNYNVPSQGEQDWHVPLNENFEAFETDVELRDSGAPDSNGYSPENGAKYLDTDAGVVYTADGSNWSAEFALFEYDDAAGTAQFGQTVVATGVEVDEVSGSVTGGTTLTDIAGNNLSIDSNGQLNASGGGGGGGISNLSGGEGIDPGSIDDGDTLSVVWGNADGLGSNGEITGGNWTVNSNDLLEPADSNVSGVDLSLVRTSTINAETNALRLKRAGNRVLELQAESGDDAGNVITGHSTNSVGSVVGATISGGGKDGDENKVEADYGTVSGGKRNRALGENSTVSGGSNNLVGDSVNSSVGEFGTVGGGAENEVIGTYGVIGGGLRNVAAGDHATIGGGRDINATGNRSTIAGGDNNNASGTAGAIPGGRNNTASGDYSFAAGRNATAGNDGAFVVGDSSTTSAESRNPDEAYFQPLVYCENGLESSGNLSLLDGNGNKVGSLAQDQLTLGGPTTGEIYTRDTEFGDPELAINVGSTSKTVSVTENGSVSAADTIRSFGDSNNLAGDFSGDVEVSGTLTAGSKNFTQTVETDDGEKEVVYTSSEAGTARTEASGVAELDDGRAEIDLPEHFGWVTSDDEPLVVQTTPYGGTAGLKVVERSTEQLVVEDLDGEGEYEFAYTVKGTREGYESKQVVRDPSASATQRTGTADD